MQVKKFEAPTIQEALDTIKRELGPEAIILATKSNRKGFGLLSRASVEVTAAVSERSIQKKSLLEKKLPGQVTEQIRSLPSGKQAEIYDGYLDRHLVKAANATRDRVEPRSSSAPASLRDGAGAYASASAQLDHRAHAVKRDGILARAAAKLAGRLAQPEPGPQLSVRGSGARYIDILDEPSPARSSAIPVERTESRGRSKTDDGGNPAGFDRPGAVPTGGGAGGAPFAPAVELAELKSAIEELRRQSAARSAPFAASPLQEAYESLVAGGVEPRFALTLAKKVEFEIGAEGASSADRVMDQLASEILEAFVTQVPKPARGPDGSPAAIALVGPTGVGKTTTLAKLADYFIKKQGMKVALVNIDQFKVAAFEQFATFAKALGVPFRSVGTASDLEAALNDFRTQDLVLFDTTGRSHRDSEALESTRRLLAGWPGLRSLLVLSATTRDAELGDMASRFRLFSPDGIVLTKLDEATTFGTILNVSQRSKLPAAFFATGQRVPDDLEEASGERVVSLLMDI